MNGTQIAVYKAVASLAMHKRKNMEYKYFNLYRFNRSTDLIIRFTDQFFSVNEAGIAAPCRNYILIFISYGRF